MRSSIQLLLLLLLACPPASARLVTVSTYAQLRDACLAALPGDTISIEPGVYTITGASRIMIAGRPGPVLVRGRTGNPADVVVEGQGQDNPAVQMVFNLDSSPQWTFRALTTRRSYYHGFKFDHSSTDCALIRVVMRDHGESGVKGTSDPAAGTYPDRLLIDSCDIGFTNASGGTRSVVEGVDGVGVNDWIIRSSRFLNVQKGGSPAYAIFTKGNSSNTVIEGCRFENCFIGASFGGGGTAPQFFRDGDQTYEHRNGIIRNNVILRCSDAGVYINKGHNCRVYNNTVFECVLTIQLRFVEATGFVRNNLVKRPPSNPNEPVVRLRDGASFLSNEANLAASDADFTVAAGNLAQLDMHLASGSAAIDAGVALPADVPRDFEGQLRPVGGAWDAGADELGIIPVELSSFSATRAADRVILSWRTESETGNLGFELLRALRFLPGDTLRWSVAAFLPARGNGRGAEYRLEDAMSQRDALAASIAYRLRQIDVDGTSALSMVLEVPPPAPLSSAISIFPNPCRTGATLHLRSRGPGPTSISIFSPSGTLLRRITAALTETAGSTAATFPVQDLAPGIYYLMVESAEPARAFPLIVHP